jgi:hypothetical protein
VAGIVNGVGNGTGRGVLKQAVEGGRALEGVGVSILLLAAVELGGESEARDVVV